MLGHHPRHRPNIKSGLGQLSRFMAIVLLVVLSLEIHALVADTDHKIPGEDNKQGVSVKLKIEFTT